jgi:sn-glycerol 3-phosphate transport system permease protein
MNVRGFGKNWLAHLVLLMGVAIVAFPIYVTFVASTLTDPEILAAPMPLIPGPHLISNYADALGKGLVSVGTAPVSVMMWNSLVMALGISIGKILISIISAFAFVYFRFPLRKLFFWLIFITLMLPVEVRIFPTYKVVSDLGMINTYQGLILPLMASATATFLFRQFFLTIPDQLAEAARIDGAGPVRFFIDILLPLSKTNIAALFVIMFIYGWNQYLWPLLITNSIDMYTVVVGVKRMMGGSSDVVVEWHLVMAAAMLAMVPPGLVVVLMQKWFVKGLIESEK